MLNVGIALTRGNGVSKTAAWSVAILVWLLAGTAVHAGGRHYYYTDPQGTVLAKADSTGNVVEASDYRPYGARALGLATDVPGYTGHFNDADSGLVYMQARYYDPQVGRFLSVDPGRHLFNRYDYVGNSPTRFTDPSGMDPECSVDCIKMRRLSDKTSSVSGVPDQSGGDVAARLVVDKVINNHFRHSYNPDPANPSSAIITPLPRSTRAALTRIILSPFGGSLVNYMLSRGGVIDLTWVSAGDAFATFGNEVWYNPDVGAFLDAHADMLIPGDGSDSTTLDILLVHEIGHTSIGHSALYQGAFSNDKGNVKEEMRAVRMYENPYRRYQGVAPRCSYFSEDDLCQ